MKSEHFKFYFLIQDVSVQGQVLVLKLVHIKEEKERKRQGGKMGKTAHEKRDCNGGFEKYISAQCCR